MQHVSFICTEVSVERSDSVENDFLFHAFCPKGPDYQNLRGKTLCQMLIMTENFQI